MLLLGPAARVAVLVMLLVAACGGTAVEPDDARPPATFTPVTGEPPAFDPITTTPTGAAAPPAAGLDAMFAQLVVEPEHSTNGYARARFEHWVDADHNGCDTRCEVLNAQRRTDLPGLRSGWFSLYDGYSTDDPSELDIDHVVALAEAWRSGADEWDSARRRAFANDLDDPGALVAVTAATNRSKGDKDPARWQPPNRDGWCEWGSAWLRVKVTWSLSADQAEFDALRNILRAC